MKKREMNNRVIFENYSKEKIIHMLQPEIVLHLLISY